MLTGIELREPIYRVARSPVWEWPDWAFAGKDGTFGNRYDDPTSNYRVLYASHTRHGCFIETLARYRPDLALYAELAEIEGPDDHVPPGVVPGQWLRERYVGMARATGTHAEIGSSESIAYLRAKLAGALVGFDLDDFDAASLQMTAPRSVTQLVSHLAFRDRFDGVRYLSKYGNDVINVAIFEGRVFFSDERETPIDHDDGELRRALDVHNLVLGDVALRGVEHS